LELEMTAEEHSLLRDRSGREVVMTTVVRTGEETTRGACEWNAQETIEEATRAARQAATRAKHAAEDVAEGVALEVRKHPLTAVGVGLAVGIVAGVVCGFGLGRLTFGKKP
jgi:ElaB/YqjD/DUF883 family membrane-anchored ribosome-binding protein